MSVANTTYTQYNDSTSEYPKLYSLMQTCLYAQYGDKMVQMRREGMKSKLMSYLFRTCPESTNRNHQGRAKHTR